MNQTQNYKKFLMNRLSVTQNIVEYIENCLILEDDVAKHSFHKIMIHHWPDKESQLLEALGDYFGATIIPVLLTNQNNITTFYTSSLIFVLKVIKLDFMFPHARNMYNVDILLNDKTSNDCFGEKTTIDDIVSGIVSNRFNEAFELDLSNFCNDPGFSTKKICFYDLSLLAYFKILMLRMGRDTRLLNLSNNNLSQIPIKIINFFIKGELIGVNLSNNNIPSFTELQRISSKIEKLWVEGNPLCEGVNSVDYMKEIVRKFPRLTELDGIKLNEHGLMMPFYRNFLLEPGKKIKMLVEKFISLYFSHYDSTRKKVDMFYDLKAQLTISSPFTADENIPYAKYSRNIIDPSNAGKLKRKHVYKKRVAIVAVLISLPNTSHDLTTFTTDVLLHDHKNLILVIDGTFKDVSSSKENERIYRFRRTFVFYQEKDRNFTYYTIKSEIFTISLASEDIVRNSFLHPIRNLNQFSLINPDTEDKKAVCLVFINVTQLKRSEAEVRLIQHDWDIRAAIKSFLKDFKKNQIAPDKFCQDTDTMLMLENEID